MGGGGAGGIGFWIVLGQKLNFSKKLDILGLTFGKSKILENLTSHETGPNSRNHTSGRPKVDFYSILDDFGQYFCDQLSFCFFEQRYSTSVTFSLPKTSPFGINFLIECSPFFA